MDKFFSWLKSLFVQKESSDEVAVPLAPDVAAEKPTEPVSGIGAETPKV